MPIAPALKRTLWRALVVLGLWNSISEWRSYRRLRSDQRRLTSVAQRQHDTGATRAAALLSARRSRTARDTSRLELASADEVRYLFSLLSVVDPGLPLMRLGSGHDGGYVVPDDLDGVVACYSPGVDTVSTFELALAAKGIPSFLADASVSGPPVNHPLLDFEPLFLGATTRPGWITLEDWIALKGPEAGDLILQMDIEGGEWAVLLATPLSLLSRFRVIVLELHGLHEAYRRQHLSTMVGALSKLNRDFVPIHVHANNYEFPVAAQGLLLPPVLEVTYLNKSRCQEPTQPPEPVTSLPNNPRVPDFPLDHRLFPSPARPG